MYGLYKYKFFHDLGLATNIYKIVINFFVMCVRHICIQSQTVALPRSRKEEEEHSVEYYVRFLCPLQCVANIWVFKYIQIFIDKYIHSHKNSC